VSQIIQALLYRIISINWGVGQPHFPLLFEKSLCACSDMRRDLQMQVKTRSNKLWRSLLLLVFIIIAVLIFSACAGAPAATEAPEAPEAPVESDQGLPVQYGQDTRTEPYQHSDSKLKEMAASVAIFVHRNQVNISGNSVTLDGYTLNEMSELGWLVSGSHAPMCTDELFSAQVAPGYCTGFLVTENILVTAGHCFVKTPCAETNIVFGFQMESADSLATITKDNVFECAQVLAQVSPNQENQYLDYAIVKLDRPTGRAGLSYTTADQLKAQDNVAVLGYPSGLPQKIASNAFVMSNDESNPYFVANLDTFGSNSGSPVINMASYQVEGILVRGTTDYVLSDDGSCVQVNRCPEGGDANCSGENATKMGMLADRISGSMASEQEELNCFPGLALAIVIVILARLKNTA
jgi:V8-like Glu-specific endopeptidase